MEAVLWWVMYCLLLECMQTLGAEDINALTCTASWFRFAVVRVRRD